MRENFKEKLAKYADSAVNPILIIICLLLTIIITINVALLVDAFLHPDKPPSVFGYSPLVMGEADSNVGLEEYTFLLASKQEPLKNGSLVAYQYWNLALLGVVENVIDNVASLNLWGDTVTLNDNNLIGGIVWTNLPLGQFLMFTQTRLGMFLFVILPLILIIVMQEHWFIKRKPEEEIAHRNVIVPEIVPLENQISFDDLLSELKQISQEANMTKENKSYRERRKEIWKKNKHLK